jgi:hypothetical protein
MKFEPINMLHSLPLERTECLDRLIRDFNIKSWAPHRPKHISELERLLVYGMAIPRRADFTDKRGSDLNCGGYLQVFDHDYLFRCESGITFSLTMPYNTHDGFYTDFDSMMRDYYEMRDRNAAFASQNTHSVYSTKGWENQFAIDQPIDALIVDDRYKIRENGSFAAIIAASSTMCALKEIMSSK